MTPYTTRAGVQIGRCYVPKRSPDSFTSSEELVQRVLLASPPVPRAERIAGVVLAIVVGASFGWILVKWFTE